MTRALALTTILSAFLAVVASSQAGPRAVRTYVYRASNGRSIGFVQRPGLVGFAPTAFRTWRVNCDAGAAPGIGEDKKGGYYIQWGLSEQYLAWPKPASQRAFYVVVGSEPAQTMKRLSSNNWQFRSGRQLVASSRGPDGAAAGLAFFAGCFS